ncbi:MAG: hypothetical protein ABSA40_04040 [Candidatus Dormibacteria bacterium]|jgi:hypothetical protein
MDSLLRDVDGISTGYLLGLLAGEAHFGGDGRQPQITLRMHVRHEGIFRWLTSRFPGGSLYGPYHHAGRDYYQWMARGPYLRRAVVPFLAQHREWLDAPARERFDAMCRTYEIEVFTRPALPPVDPVALPGGPASAPLPAVPPRPQRRRVTGGAAAGA